MIGVRTIKGMDMENRTGVEKKPCYTEAMELSKMGADGEGISCITFCITELMSMFDILNRYIGSVNG